MSLYVQMCSCMMIYANLDFSDIRSPKLSRAQRSVLPFNQHHDCELRRRRAINGPFS